MEQALEGIRVVTLAVNLPGPVAARRLLGLGAAVVKVEPPAGDPMALYERGFYRALAAGQEVVTLDLKAPAGREAFEALLARADLLLTAQRPSALARLGLGWEVLHARHPRLCQVAIVGFPAPRQEEGGHDLTYQASAGLVQPPRLPASLLADMAGGEQAATTALALLLARARDGRGRRAEVALSDAVAALAEPRRHGLTAPGALLGGGAPEYNLYEARGGWVAVAALEPHFRERLLAGLAARDEEGLRRAFLGRTPEAWQAWGVAEDVPIVALPPA
jgi:crotonobetainyl-CoA:carnitine CoA-transferase CaiB-like acyl-CoA transferase